MANLGKNLLAAAEIVERQVDAQIEELDNLKDEDIENIRKKRLLEMKKMQAQKEEWLSTGHGKYDEIADEREFFDVCKKSKNVICHFYRNTTLLCKVIIHTHSSISNVSYMKRLNCISRYLIF